MYFPKLKFAKICIENYFMPTQIMKFDEDAPEELKGSESTPGGLVVKKKKSDDSSFKKPSLFGLEQRAKEKREEKRAERDKDRRSDKKVSLTVSFKLHGVVITYKDLSQYPMYIMYDI